MYMFVCLFICLFVLHLLQKELALGSFPPRQTIKAFIDDCTHSKEVTGLDVIDSYHSNTETVKRM